MKSPFWKVWLSYLYDIPVETVPSGHHMMLSVCLSRGRYQLSTPHAVYSYGDLYSNFNKVFRELDWSAMKGDQVLLLGLGLGSIPFMLENTFNKSFEYTGIEVDAQVIRLANKYVLKHLKSQVTVYQTDATDFVNMTERKWDLICSDIFVDDKIPEPMLSEEFLMHVKSCLSTEGLLLYNCLSRTKEDLKITTDFLDHTFLKVFPEGYILDVGGNWILASEKRFFNKKENDN